MPRHADFTQAVKDKLAAKVGYHCSNPFCRKSTIGANQDGSGTINIGEAAHITAASPGGPRYDPIMSDEDRKSESNGIWLCRDHAAMIDRDSAFFTVDMLKRWKATAEKEANDRIQGIIPSENLLYNLRVLYDDLKVCCDAINWLIQIDMDVVLPPQRFPVPSEFEKKVETVVDSIGIDYASRIRRCFIEISGFRTVLAEDMPRFKNRLGKIADASAVKYGQYQRAFLSSMEKYDIHELVSTIGELFKTKEDAEGGAVHE